MHKYTWELEWKQLFPRRQFSDENWKNQFGLHVDDVDYLWLEYHKSAKINSSRDLLILLRFLKTNCTQRENSAIFGLSPQQISNLISQLLVSLASKLHEVSNFEILFSQLIH